MKKIVTVFLCMLLAVLIVGCGKPQEQTGTPPTANVEPRSGEVEQVSKLMPQEQQPAPEKPKEEPAPAPQPPPPKPAPAPTVAPKQPTVQKTTTSTGKTSNTTPKTVSTMKMQGTVISIQGMNLDKGIVQTSMGKKYNFVNTANLKLGDMVEFQLDNDYYAINIKLLAHEGQQANSTNTTR